MGKNSRRRKARQGIEELTPEQLTELGNHDKTVDKETSYLLQLGNSTAPFTLVLEGDGTTACYRRISSLDALIMELQAVSEHHKTRSQETGRPTQTVYFLNSGNSYHR